MNSPGTRANGGRAMAVVQHTEDRLGEPSFRRTLQPKRGPYFVSPMMGRAIGYRRLAIPEGRWIARIGKVGGGYVEKTLGQADDVRNADGQVVLNFRQATDHANRWFESPAHLNVRVEARRHGKCEQICLCPIGSQYTVGHAIAEYVEWKRNFQAYESFVSTVAVANAYILPQLGNIPCSELTTDQARSIFLLVESTRRKRGSSQENIRIDPESLDSDSRRKRRITANNTFTLLRTALNKAFREGKIESDAAWRHIKLFAHVFIARPTALSWHEAKVMVDSAPADIRRLILAALYTGCRVTELYKIRAGDLHSTRKALYIHPLKNYRGRTIALPDEGYDFFRSLILAKGKDAVVLVRDDGGDWNASYLAKRFRRLCRKLGHSDEVVFHSLRHTYASLLLQAGTSPIVVARQLGHVTMATVIKTYAHVTDDFIDIEFRTKFKPGFLTSPDLFNQATE